MVCADRLPIRITGWAVRVCNAVQTRRQSVRKGRQKTGPAGKECNGEEVLKGRLELNMR